MTPHPALAGIRDETPQDEAWMRQECAAALPGGSLEVAAAAKAFDRIAPCAFIDIGCWMGALSAKIAATTRRATSFYLMDTSVTFAKIAGELVGAQAEAWTVVSDMAETPTVCAEVGRSLFGTSMVKHLYAEPARLIKLKTGPPITGHALMERLAPRVNGAYLKVDINGHEPLVLRAVNELGLRPAVAHSKLTRGGFQACMRELRRLCERLGYRQPPAILDHLSNDTYATVLVSQQYAWCEILGTADAKTILAVER